MIARFGCSPTVEQGDHLGSPRRHGRTNVILLAEDRPIPTDSSHARSVQVVVVLGIEIPRRITSSCEPAVVYNCPAGYEPEILDIECDERPSGMEELRVVRGTGYFPTNQATSSMCAVWGSVSNARAPISR